MNVVASRKKHVTHFCVGPVLQEFEMRHEDPLVDAFARVGDVVNEVRRVAQKSQRLRVFGVKGSRTGVNVIKLFSFVADDRAK